MADLSPAMKQACEFYRRFNKEGLTLPKFSQGEQHALHVLAAFIEDAAASLDASGPLRIFEAGEQGAIRTATRVDYVAEGEDSARIEIELAPPTDEQIKRAMLIQLRQQADKMADDFWKDRQIATIEHVAELPLDDPEMQEGITLARVFLGLIYQPLATETPDGDQE